MPASLLPSPTVGGNLAGLAAAYSAEVLAPLLRRLDARRQPGDEPTTDDDSCEMVIFFHYGHGRVPILHKERQDDGGAFVDVRDLLGLDHHALGLAYLGVVHVLHEALHVLVRGLAQDLLRGAELHNLAVLHDRHPVPE